MRSKTKRSRTEKKRGRLLLLVLLTVVWIPAFSWVFLKTPLCDVKRINVHGIRYGYPEDVLLESGIEEGINIFSDMSAFEQALNAHPMVRLARVERRPPHTLFIRVEEREPFAYVNGGEPVLVARDGTPLPVNRVAVELDLPILTVLEAGDQQEDQMLEGLDFLARFRRSAPSLYTHISELVVSDGRPAQLFLRAPRARVLLGERFTRVSSNLLAGVLSSLRKDEGFLEIDLRFRDQAIVRSLEETDPRALARAI